MATVAIVLSAGSSGKRMNHLTRERVESGAQLFMRGTVDKLILSGPVEEVESMRLYLSTIGVHPDCVLLETLSSNTIDRALYCTEILQKIPDAIAYVVTHEYHEERAMYWFERFGARVIPFPVESKRLKRSSALGVYHYLKDRIAFWATLMAYEFKGFNTPKGDNR